MVAGRRPFRGNTRYELAAAILDASAAPRPAGRAGGAAARRFAQPDEESGQSLPVRPEVAGAVDDDLL